jgi:hypothetical protein
VWLTGVGAPIDLMTGPQRDIRLLRHTAERNSRHGVRSVSWVTVLELDVVRVSPYGEHPHA